MELTSLLTNLPNCLIPSYSPSFELFRLPQLSPENSTIELLLSQVWGDSHGYFLAVCSCLYLPGQTEGQRQLCFRWSGAGSLYVHR